MTTVSSSTSSTTTTTTSTSTSTTSSSSSSDIDWDGIIEAAVAQKQLPADRVSAKITENEAAAESYGEMQDLLIDVLDAIETIRGTADSLLDEDDIFSAREAYLTGNGGITASDAVVVTADSGVAVQTYDLEISQLALSQKVASDTQSSSTDALGLDGTFSLKLDGSSEDATEFVIDEDMSLDDIAEAINAESDTTGVTATVVAVSDTEYKMVLTGETGQDIELESVTGTDIGQSLGFTDSDGNFENEIQASQDAIITIDGIEITRDSNTIDDALEGITFSIYQTTDEDESISVEIGQSLSDIKSAVTSLVDAYNAYREWALTQQEVDASGGASDDAALFGDSILRNTNSAIADALSTVIDGESMALLGLSYDSSNNLELDEDVLNDALLNDIDQIEDLLNFQYSTSNSDLALLARNENMPSSLTLDIEVDADGEVTNVSVDGNDSLFTVSGTRIVGVEGTAYEGISFVYTGTEDASITFTSSSGIVEQLFQAVSKYADEDDSILTDKITSLDEQNEDYQTQYDSMMETVEAYQAHLIELYAEYQQQISEAESTLDYLEALLDSGD